MGLSLLAAPAHAGFDIFSVGGDTTAASIQPTIDAFRDAIGGVNNGDSPVPQSGGRREVNWDEGGSGVATTDQQFLDLIDTRGILLITEATGLNYHFLQTPLTDPAFTSINPTYATTFSTFSPKRVLTQVESNVTYIDFVGYNRGSTASVAGFGVVFSDVDLANTTRIELLDYSFSVIATLYAPPGVSEGNGSLSFIGGLANAGERAAFVRITAGNSALGPSDSNGNPVDVVVMDDFIYAEPQVIPEPASVVILVAAMVGSIFMARCRD